eukprot:CAMPEP_0174842206 /NCGR_PEP_ID=MMETSP1114-20130205/9766_1 /TAXON_ID=312471 /ORGANISM="Neobodo designis, Strain CCAP 1951/1" /LENGTH=296 /DNA_ID=CAMNT_0016076403 /DNA_START=72 /DNA_END=959 /DNA_ORIENTATION=-
MMYGGALLRRWDEDPRRTVAAAGLLGLHTASSGVEAPVPPPLAGMLFWLLRWFYPMKAALDHAAVGDSSESPCPCLERHVARFRDVVTSTLSFDRLDDAASIAAEFNGVGIRAYRTPWNEAESRVDHPAFEVTKGTRMRNCVGPSQPLAPTFPPGTYVMQLGGRVELGVAVESYEELSGDARDRHDVRRHVYIDAIRGDDEDEDDDPPRRRLAHLVYVHISDRDPKTLYGVDGTAYHTAGGPMWEAAWLLDDAATALGFVRHDGDSCGDGRATTRSRPDADALVRALLVPPFHETE